MASVTVWPSIFASYASSTAFSSASTSAVSCHASDGGKRQEASGRVQVSAQLKLLGLEPVMLGHEIHVPRTSATSFVLCLLFSKRFMISFTAATEVVSASTARSCARYKSCGTGAR